MHYYMYMYSRHQKKIPVLQNGTDSFVVENGKRTDTKRIAHGYRKERPVPFCFPFRSVYFLFVRSIPFTTCASPYFIRAIHIPGSSTRRSALPGPSAVQPSCETSPYALFSQSAIQPISYLWPGAVQLTCERFE